MNRIVFGSGFIDGCKMAVIDFLGMFQVYRWLTGGSWTRGHRKESWGFTVPPVSEEWLAFHGEQEDPEVL